MGQVGLSPHQPRSAQAPRLAADGIHTRRDSQGGKGSEKAAIRAFDERPPRPERRLQQPRQRTDPDQQRRHQDDPDRADDQARWQHVEHPVIAPAAGDQGHRVEGQQERARRGEVTGSV